MWINVLVTSLFSALAAWLPNIVARVITAAGFGYVTYNLGTYAFDSIFNLFKGYILQLDSDLLILLSLAKIDDAIGIIFGGFVASTTLKMTTIHTIRQFRPMTKD
jgi:hypothetical protein